MLIAKVQDGIILDVADYRAMFPGVSFSQDGPDDNFMVQNGCMYVNVFKPYDSNTQKLAPATPYIELTDPLHWVYTVEVIPLTPEEIEQMNENKRQMNKAEASTLLSDTDWTQIADVSTVTETAPYLMNANEFIPYRETLREIAVNPPILVDPWPVKPIEVWSQPAIPVLTVDSIDPTV